MTKSVELDFPNFDEQTVASQGNAVLGIRDSGKSYTAVGIAERFHDAGIPFVSFDPIGKWRFLRVPGQGAGYPIVVAGGAAGDLPLTVESAPSIVRAAMENGISLVIDLYDMEVSKADWKRIVADSVRVLLYENGSHGLRHIFIEEAAEFCPQRVGPDQGRVYAEIEKLARMGGNARLGYTLINQRAEEVNKAVLELCDNLFLHRQKGRNSLNALTKWLDVADVRAGKEIVSTLPTLPQGECWAWMAGTDRPVHVKVPAKNSFEPDRRAMRGDVASETKQSVQVDDFVAAMRAALADSAKSKEAKASEGGRKAVSPPLHSSKAAADEVAEACERANVDGFERGLIEGEKRGYVRGYSVALAAAQGALNALRVPETAEPSAWRNVIVNAPAPVQAATRPSKAAQPKAGANGLDGAALNLLRAIDAYSGRGLTWDEACIVAGMKPGNGYFYGGKKRLLDGAYVEERDGRVYLGLVGHFPAGDDVHLSRSELVRIWQKLKQPAPRMLEYLAEQGARTVPVDELARAISCKPGNGYWYGGVAQLRDANLIEDTKGSLRLSEFMREAK